MSQEPEEEGSVELMSVHTPTEQEQVATRLFEAMEAGNGDVVGELLAEDVTWTFPGDFEFSGTHVGKASVFSDLLAVTGPYFEPGHLSIEMRNLISHGNLVVAEYIGRNRTVTGRDYENPYVFVLEVENGKIKAIRTYTDTIHTRKVMYGS
jgi:ketosteroid isomerase-like protein